MPDRHRRDDQQRNRALQGDDPAQHAERCAGEPEQAERSPAVVQPGGHARPPGCSRRWPGWPGSTTSASCWHPVRTASCVLAARRWWPGGPGRVGALQHGPGPLDGGRGPVGADDERQDREARPAAAAEMVAAPARRRARPGARRVPGAVERRITAAVRRPGSGRARGGGELAQETRPPARRTMAGPARGPGSGGERVGVDHGHARTPGWRARRASIAAGTAPAATCTAGPEVGELVDQGGPGRAGPRLPAPR